MTTRIDRGELRALIRQALAEAFGDAVASAAPPPVPEGLVGELRAKLGRGTPAQVAVNLESGADLDRFARDLIHAAEHPDLKAAILSGSIRFVPSAVGSQTTSRQVPLPAADRGPKGTYHMTAGVLTESKVVELGATHARIILGTGVVLTPLARDRAREIKVELVRQKP